RRLQRGIAGARYPEIPPVAPHLATGGPPGGAPAATHDAPPAPDHGRRTLPALLPGNDGVGACGRGRHAAAAIRARGPGGSWLPGIDCPADAGAAAAGIPRRLAVGIGA